MDFGAESLPFVLRPKKLRSLSNEALAKYRKVSLNYEWAQSFAEVDIRLLSSALRKFDTEGYGHVQKLGFGLALREIEMKSIPKRLFEALSAGMGVDIEVFLAIVQYWQQENIHSEIMNEPSVLSDDWRLENEINKLEARLASPKRRKELEKVLTRLDPHGLGALSSELLLLALTDAGIAIGPVSNQALSALAPPRDNLFYYEQLLKNPLKKQIETPAWRAAASAWKRLSIRAKRQVSDASSLGRALELGGERLVPADLAIVWRRLRGLNCQQIDDLFQIYSDDVDNSIKQEISTPSQRSTPPFALDIFQNDYSTKEKPFRSTVRRTALAARDESENEWPQPENAVAAHRLRDARRNVRGHTMPPPYWTHDLLKKEKFTQERKPVSFFESMTSTQIVQDDIPILARKLRRAAKVADISVLRSAVSMVLSQDPAQEAALTRAQLQGLAQHFGLPLACGEIEILIRWLDKFLIDKNIKTQAECAAALLDIPHLPIHHPLIHTQSVNLPRYGLTTRPSTDEYDDYNDYFPYDENKNNVEDFRDEPYDTYVPNDEQTEDHDGVHFFDECQENEDDDTESPPPPPPDEESLRDQSPSPPPPDDILPSKPSPEDKESFQPELFVASCQPEVVPAGIRRDSKGSRSELNFDLSSLRKSIGNKVRASPTLTTVSKRGLTTSSAARLRAAFRSQAASNRDTLFQRIVARGDDDVLDLESGAVARSPDIAKVLRDVGILLSENELRVLLADSIDTEPKPTDAIDESRCFRTAAIISQLHHMAKYMIDVEWQSTELRNNEPQVLL